MDATTTHSTPWLIQQLKAAHPTLLFKEADYFSWSPSEQTIFYAPNLPNARALLLHELSHALLEHRNYQRDVELLQMEATAWERASAYANELGGAVPSFSMDDDVVQDHLDTYREWLHARSSCPNCKATGFQSNKAEYTCPACSQIWRVNEARLCALRRYSV